MAFLFIGGEDIDFTMGRWAPGTDNGTFRSGYARCALTDNYPSPSGEDVSPMSAVMSAPSSNFYLGCRAYLDGGGIGSNGASFLAFYTGTTKLLSLRLNGSNFVEIVAWGNATSPVVLATSPNPLSYGLLKLDVKVNYGVSGNIIVYVNNDSIVSYTGDVTVNGATTLNRFAFFRPGIGQMGISECVVAERDTRTFSVKTHAPNGIGSGSQWVGSYTDVDETRANEVDVVYTSTADQIFSSQIDDAPSGNYTIRAVKVSAYGSRGETGPQNVQLGVLSGSTDAYGPTHPLDTGWTRVGETFETNPVTGSAWDVNTLNGLEIRLKSKS